MPHEPSPAVVWGRRAWTAIGIAVLAVAVVFVASQVSIILTPFVLALFPAALLNPLAARLRGTRIPNSVVSLLILLLLAAVIAGAMWFIVPAFISQVPQIVDSVRSGLAQLDEAIDWSVLPGDIEGLSDLVEPALDALASSGALTQGLSAAGAVGTFVTGLVLMIVVLFFFLKDGRRIWQAFLDFVPRPHQARVDLVADQSFWTIGAYFRGQLLIAFVDAVFIGLGLWILGVPLVLPLAVLVFLGGLIPIVGAFVSGAVAVVVALADQGLVTALLALGVVLLVRQLEGNLLEPLIQSRTIKLHPLLIILVVTAGGVLMGVLGAFLAVPVAAVVARIVDNLRGRAPEAGPAAGKDPLARDHPLAPPPPDDMDDRATPVPAGDAAPAPHDRPAPARKRRLRRRK